MPPIDERENIAETLARVLPQAQVLEGIFNETDAEEVFHVAIPTGQTLQSVDLIQYRDAPRRATGAPSFTTAESFLAYVKDHRQAGTAVWCTFDPQTFALSFLAVLNDHAGEDGAPGWRDHRAKFTPAMSAEWKTWTSRNGVEKAFGQVEFAEFIEANAEDIAAKDGYPTDLQMLSMATNFVANEDRRLKSSVRLQSGGVRLEYVEDADAGTVQAMEMFGKFALGIPVFQGALEGQAWPIDARLKYRTPQGTVKFFYELVRPDRVHESAAKKLIEQVRAGLEADSVPLLMGAFN